MRTYLFSWNPKRFEWNNLEVEIGRLERTGKLRVRWTCGVARHIERGSRFFLIRLGVAPKGIVGSGEVVSRPRPGRHFSDPERTAHYVGVDFDRLVPTPAITLGELKEPPFSAFPRWEIQGSGVSLPENIAEPLEQLWAERTGGEALAWAGEIQPGETYSEGAVRTVKVNAHERNPRARQACLAHYGDRCVICGFSFGERYGHGDRVSVHVHHLLPLEDAAGPYEVDPIADLRPLCPNCHTMAHSRRPPFSLDELASLLRSPRR